MLQDAIIVGKDRLGTADKNARKLVKELDGKLSRNEHKAIMESINSKAIPTPLILAKDHSRRRRSRFEENLVRSKKSVGKVVTSI